QRARGRAERRGGERLGLDLGPCRDRGPGRRLPGLGEDATSGLEDDRLAEGRTDVDAQEARGHAYAAASRIDSISAMRRRPVSSRNRRRSGSGSPTASFQSERPAMKPLAPPSMADRSCSQNARWSTPAESTAQGTSSASVTRAHSFVLPGYSSLRTREPHSWSRTAPSRTRSALRAANASGASSSRR